MRKRKVSIAALSVASNSFLVVFKLAVGLYIGSVAVVSEAMHSAVDLLAAIIALVAVKRSSVPPDGEHAFGHGKIENISGAIEALLIFLAAAWIIFEAVRKLLQPEASLDFVEWGIAVMLLSTVLNTVVSHFLFKVGRETESPALLADAWHLRTDVWTSAGVMGGLALIWVSEWVFDGQHFHWLDPVAAILVALLIIRAAYHLTIESGRDLLDVALPAEEEDWIRQHLQSRGSPVHGFQNLRTRKSGSTRFVDVDLVVNAELSVESSHRIAEEISGEIRQHLPGAEVMIHVEPYGGRPDGKEAEEKACG